MRLRRKQVCGNLFSVVKERKKYSGFSDNIIKYSTFLVRTQSVTALEYGRDDPDSVPVPADYLNIFSSVPEPLIICRNLLVYVYAHLENISKVESFELCERYTKNIQEVYFLQCILYQYMRPPPQSIYGK